MTDVSGPEVDPITYEVVKHRLWQINDEQGVTIRSLSTSPIVVEGNDFNVGLFTPDGELAVAGPYVLSHVTTMDAVIKNVIARVGDEAADGDMYLVNDPALGALHQNDAALVSPVFADGQLALWVGNVVHHADLAGIDEGSFCINAREIFQEAPRYFLKLVQQGVLSREAEYTFVNNSRLPESVALDLRAQLGAINVARGRLRAVLAEYGLSTVWAVMNRSVDDAERQLRELLAGIPDGEWEADCYMDGDRVGSDRILRVHVALRKTGTRLTFDFAGSDRQSDGAANATMYACYAGATTPVYAFLCGGDIDWNSSVKRCVEVTAPEGTVMNARHPAAVSLCSIGFTWLAAVAAQKVVADMLLTSPTYRHRACPSWGVACNGNNLFAVRSDGELAGALLSDHRSAGAGARPSADGCDHAGVIFSALSFMSNVEGQEWKLPVLYLFRSRLADSGGPGEFRGGLTAVSALTPYGVDEVVWKSQNTAGSDQSNASGLSGGYPGAGSQVSVVRNRASGTGVAERVLATSWADLAGDVEHLPTKSEGQLRAGEVFVLCPPGGGGFGDPLDRIPAAVERDLASGAVTAQAAARYYGIVLDGAGMVDLAGTEAERGRLRRDRLHHPPDTLDVTVAGDGRLTGRCADCDATTHTWDTHLAEAGPWLAQRWRGHSPNFRLRHTACQGCGRLLDVRETRVSVAP